MLQLRPHCEFCEKELPASSTEAMICTYECTFCRTCVKTVLLNVCPNCGGGFSDRPIRPKTARRNGISLIHQPASDKKVTLSYSNEEIREFVKKIAHIPPEER